MLGFGEGEQVAGPKEKVPATESGSKLTWKETKDKYYEKSTDPASGAVTMAWKGEPQALAGVTITTEVDFSVAKTWVGVDFWRAILSEGVKAGDPTDPTEFKDCTFYVRVMLPPPLVLCGRRSPRSRRRRRQPGLGARSRCAHAVPPPCCTRRTPPIPRGAARARPRPPPPARAWRLLRPCAARRPPARARSPSAVRAAGIAHSPAAQRTTFEGDGTNFSLRPGPPLCAALWRAPLSNAPTGQRAFCR